MNPQDPQQQYGQPTYTPQSPPQVTQPSQLGNTLPPVSPPLPNPGSSDHNPYEFILNPDTSRHKAPLGNSLLKRIMTIVGILIVITLLGFVVYRLLIPQDASTQQVTTIAQEQQELVRVAKFVAGHASSSDLVNFAINTQLSVGTNQQAAVDYAANRGVKLDTKLLALKQDADTDKLFTSALSSNTFDTTATRTLNTQLSTYQANLKKAYAATTGKKALVVLQASYDTAVILAAQGALLK